MNKNWLINQLPDVMAKDPFIRQFTGIFQEIATGIREEANSVPEYVNVGVAPHEFVQWIGGWTGLPVQIDYGDDEIARERVKTMVRSSAMLYRRRGTLGGLQGLLAAVTGEEVTVSDTGGIFRSDAQVPDRRHVTVGLPDAGGLSVSLLTSLLEDELPVNCSFDLVIGGRIQASRELDNRSSGGSS